MQTRTNYNNVGTACVRACGHVFVCVCVVTCLCVCVCVRAATQETLQGALSVPSFTAAGSLVAAINALGVTKVAFASPYVGEINVQAMDFLQSCGIGLVRCADVGSDLVCVKGPACSDLDSYGQGTRSRPLYTDHVAACLAVYTRTHTETCYIHQTRSPL